MVLSRSIFVSSLAAACASIAPRVVRAQAAGASPVRIGVVPVEVCAEAFFGVDLGIFKKAGIEVELDWFSSPGAVSTALAGNAIDIGLFDSAGLVSAYAHNLPVVLLAPGKLYEDIDPEIGLVVRSDGPKIAKDLTGTTVAVPSVNNIGALQTLAWLDHNAGDSKSVKFAEIPFTAMNEAVLRGSVVGAVSVEPWLSDAREKGLRTVVLANGLGPVFVASAWVATKRWADADPALADRVVSAIYACGHWGNTNAAASVPIVAKYTKVPAETIAKIHRGRFAESIDLKTIQPVIDGMVKYGYLAKGFPASELLARGGKGAA